jgi:sigma-B regulation protein RsbU (phosphoserine phosphatase)
LIVRRRILVVDDDPGMLRAMRRVLEEGYEVAVAGGAEEAEGLLPLHRSDLAILDVRMPHVDGFELMRRLKVVRPDLDVILMTGSADEGDEKLVRSIRERAFYFIRKPFDREVLRTLVERCLEQRRLTQENRRHLERLENVLTEARAFQASLLPGPRSRVGSVDVAARFVPCDQLCGDFYDYLPASGGRVAFIVADVSGHGASAAMLTGVVKSAFRSSDRERFEPHAVADRIWAGIRTFRANRFVSLFCGRLDPRAKHLEYVNAGHPPALLWSASGERSSLGPTGPIVSPVWDAPDWQVRVHTFEPGTRLLAYTDGVSEAPGPGPEEMFGAERIEALIARYPAGGDALLDGVLGDVATFMHGRRPVDDQTLLTLGLP